MYTYSISDHNVHPVLQTNRYFVWRGLIPRASFVPSWTVNGAYKQIVNENKGHIRLEKSTYNVRANTITPRHLRLISLNRHSEFPLLDAKCNLAMDVTL